MDESGGRDELGEGTGRQGPWATEEEGARAAKQQADPGALEVEGDPRGGLQSEEYRTADPREVVEEEGVAMSAPGGAPQEDSSIEERRDASADLRDQALRREPPA